MTTSRFNRCLKTFTRGWSRCQRKRVLREWNLNCTREKRAGNERWPFFSQKLGELGIGKQCTFLEYSSKNNKISFSHWMRHWSFVLLDNFACLFVFNPQYTVNRASKSRIDSHLNLIISPRHVISEGSCPAQVSRVVSMKCGRFPLFLSCLPSETRFSREYQI